MPISRRQFIKRSATAVTVGMVAPQWLAGEARSQQIELAGGRRFVIIQMAASHSTWHRHATRTLIREEFALLLRLAFVLAVHIGPDLDRRLPRACPFTANQRKNGDQCDQRDTHNHQFHQPADGVASFGCFGPCAAGNLHQRNCDHRRGRL